MACRARLPQRDGRRPRRRHTIKSHPVPFPVGEEKTGSWADQTADASWAWCRQESGRARRLGWLAGAWPWGLVVDLGVGGVALDCLHPFEGAALAGVGLAGGHQLAILGLDPEAVAVVAVP